MNPPIEGSNAFSLGVWCEHLGPTEVEKLLPDLSRAGVRLHLSIPATSAASDYDRLFEECRKLGIELWAWPLLSESDGYWPNASNASLFADRVKVLLDHWSGTGVLPAGISVDFEPSLDRLRQYLRLIETRDWRALWRTLKAQAALDMEPALQIYDRLTHELRSKGVAIHAVTTPFVLDDLELGSWSVRSMLGLPLRPESYDWVSFMAYRSEYERWLGHLGWALARDTARRARGALGGRAGLDVGVVGDITFPHLIRGMAHLAEVQAELQAARSEGQFGPS